MPGGTWALRSRAAEALGLRGGFCSFPARLARLLEQCSDSSQLVAPGKAPSNAPFPPSGPRRALSGCRTKGFQPVHVPHLSSSSAPQAVSSLSLLPAETPPGNPHTHLSAFGSDLCLGHCHPIVDAGWARVPGVSALLLWTLSPGTRVLVSGHPEDAPTLHSCIQVRGTAEDSTWSAVWVEAQGEAMASGTPHRVRGQLPHPATRPGAPARACLPAPQKRRLISPAQVWPLCSAGTGAWSNSSPVGGPPTAAFLAPMPPSNAAGGTLLPTAAARVSAGCEARRAVAGESFNYNLPATAPLPGHTPGATHFN